MRQEDGPLLPMGGRDRWREHAQVLHAVCELRGAVHTLCLDMRDRVLE